MKLTFTSLLIVLFLAPFSTTNAQEFDIFADFEIGLHISGALRDFHKELVDQIPFENFKTTDNFIHNYGFAIGFRLNKKASIFFGNRVSGAKSSLADYSGFVRLTNELNAYTFGAEYEIPLKELNNGNLNLGIKGLVTPSKLTLTSESKILDERQMDSVEFKSLDFGGALGLNYEHNLSFITLRAHLDLNVYVGGKLTLDGDDSGGFLTYQSGNKVTTGWTGLTGGIGFILPLSK